jgi:cytochrome P450
MVQEADRAMATWTPGRTLDVYEWVRDLAMSIAMRALVGLDPRSGGIGHQAAVLFERALAFYDTESWMMLLRGPGTPWARMLAVWFGPRMSVKPFRFGGCDVPAGVHVIHSAWVSDRLPEAFPNPEAFIPERFTPEARRQLPPGAYYIPFGGGQRVCIGKRFGQLMVKAVATSILQKYGLDLKPGYELRVAKLPTLSPEGGLPMIIRQAHQPVATRDTVLSTWRAAG